MYDLNDCRFTGTLTEIRQLDTKSGIAMASFKLQCYKELIRCVCFKEQAVELLRDYQVGSRIQIRGRVQSSTWEQEGIRMHGYQVNVQAIDTGQSEHVPVNEQRHQDEQRRGVQDYTEGPF